MGNVCACCYVYEPFVKLEQIKNVVRKGVISSKQPTITLAITLINETPEETCFVVENNVLINNGKKNKNNLTIKALMGYDIDETHYVVLSEKQYEYFVRLRMMV